MQRAAGASMGGREPAPSLPVCYNDNGLRSRGTPGTRCQELAVANPWTKKNPFLSVWLSGVHALAGKARAAGSAEMGRRRASLTKDATRFWTGAWLAALKPTVRKRRRR